MNNTKYILINGKKGSGKDFIGNKLKESLINKGYTCELDSFALPMKKIISSTFDISEEDLESYKNNPEEISVEIMQYPEGTDDSELRFKTDFRTILQRFGTEAMKPIFGNSVWADVMYSKSREVEFVIVTDFRFKVEYNKLVNNITVKVQGDGITSSESHQLHSSETELDDFDFDMYIDNSEKTDITDKLEVLTEDIILWSKQ